MYSNLPNFILGFHGCDNTVAERILLHNDQMRPSDNDYDWLGPGIYFWENNPQRALAYAQMLKDKPHRVKNPIHEPASIGAILDLGHCLNLLEQNSLDVLKRGYEILQLKMNNLGTTLPVNKFGQGNESEDLLLRFLDCAVIQAVHEYNKENNQRPYDTVRGVFFEGKDLYPGAGFRERNHIQVCVINPNCIKGYFKPMNPSNGYEIP
ncbi:hypothetical protein [Paenibacillus sp. URB8-2]|uniref:hypothetical protein n=1 Tax=Paenibacillus sp. URB8-2 TaxID=2741301 RepID=UPI0015B9682C|nr:hypothetical protein [Paenibacillus sp. URB8-2]BCG58515.1 hypothetical protein PUR_19400 [Paenibacillus sp. URB8-2]